MHDHLVEFYESEPLLVESVRDFLCPALEYGDPVILVATGEHRIRFIEAIESRGIDVEAARREARFVDLDAAETLSGFMAGNSPDPELFEQVVGGLVGSTGNGTGKLRIYGEMVALLWDGAIAAPLCSLKSFEQPRQPASVHPAVRLAPGVDGLAPNTAPFRGICSSHSSVRLRFSVLQPEQGSPPVPLTAGAINGLEDLGSELSALKEVIKNASQAGWPAESSLIAAQAE